MFHEVLPKPLPPRSEWPSIARARSAGTSAGAFAARGKVMASDVQLLHV